MPPGDPRCRPSGQALAVALPATAAPRGGVMANVSTAIPLLEGGCGPRRRGILATAQLRDDEYGFVFWHCAVADAADGRYKLALVEVAKPNDRISSAPLRLPKPSLKHIQPLPDASHP